MAIPYDYYRIFYHVAQQHSFTRAAEVLSNNQPNITRCMNNLEAELGCRLFLRSNRGVTLTPEGEKLFTYVQVAYQQLTAGEEELRKASHLETGMISISASETALHLMLMKKLSEFYSRYPNIQLRITNDTTPMAVQAVEQSRVDCAIITSPIQESRTLQVTPLQSYQDIMVCGSNYRDLAAKPRHLKELRALPLICLGSGTSTYEFYQQLYAKQGLPFRVDMATSTMDQVLPMVLYNLGIGFVPEPMAVPSLSRREIFQIPLRETIPTRNIALVEDAARPQSVAFQALKKLLLQPEA